MNILYGVSGDGLGHSSRALVIAGFLEKQGHKVVIMTYGRAYKVLKDKFNVFKIGGMFIVFVKGVLKKRRTIKVSAKNFSENASKWRKFHKLMKEFKPDLCIADMEPIVPILSFWYRLPLISIDNQHRLTNLELKVPKKYYPDYLMAKSVVDAFVSRADHYIVTSFSKAKIIKKNTILVSPLVRPAVRKVKPKYGKKILVYVTRKNRRMLNILKKINEKFVVFGYNVNKKDENLELKTKESFLKDLKNCKAIIGTAGFTLMSEAIYLKKPFFAIPLKNQFEQTLNALFLKKAGFGEFVEDIEEKKLVYFLSNLAKYKKNLKKYKFDFKKLPRTLKKIIKKYS